MSLADEISNAAESAGADAPVKKLTLADQVEAAASGASSPDKARPPVVASSGLERFGSGLADLPYKAAQLITHSMPDSFSRGLDSFNRRVAKTTGAEFVSTSDLDKRLNERESKYETERAAAGSSGFDWTRLAGNIANPINYAIPGGGAVTTLGRIGAGAAQGAVSSVLASPTTGEDQKNFWGTQGKLAATGAAAGGAFTAGAEAVSPYVGAAWKKLSSFVRSPSAESGNAAGVADAAFTAKGVDPSKLDPSTRAQFLKQVQESINAGVTPDAKTLANLAEAHSLPVPVPMLRGQASRDAMQFAKEQNLRGITGVGEPITATMGAQNRALIENLDAMGAKGAPNVVDAGQTAINTLKNIDARARESVSSAYDAFKSATGKTMDVPLQGVAQDYARVADEYGLATIPQGVRNQLDKLGLMKGQQMKTFSIDDAEGMLKIINKNYDPSNKAQSSALDEIRRSIHGAISNGAGSNAEGAQAIQLAQQARSMAAQRFKLIDSVPAYKAAISDIAPDKFLQRHFWNGNAGDIANLKALLGGTDKNALDTVKSSIMGDIKQTALNNQSAENGIFSQSKFNGILRDQNHIKRLGALFEPEEVGAMSRLGNVAENVMLAPKAAAVNTSNTTSSAANLVQTAAQGGLGTKLLTLAGKAQVPIVSPLSAGLANKGSGMALRDLVRHSTQPLSTADFDMINLLTRKSGTVGGIAANAAQRK